MEFKHKYWCRYCGVCLFESETPIKVAIHIKCPKSNCGEWQIMCEPPISFDEQLKTLNGKQDFEDKKFKEKEFVKCRFIAEKRMMAKYK